MKQNIILFVLIMLILPCVSLGQIRDKDYYHKVAQGLGYYYGVEISIIAISQKYPDLAKRAQLCELNFQLAHKGAKDELEKVFAKYYDNDEHTFRDVIMTEADKRFDINSLTYKESVDFLNNFDNERINGSSGIYGDFIDILLSHNPTYLAIPAKEFLNGYRKKLETEGHPKSKGLNLSIEYPRSWKKKEGNRPNIIYNISNNKGSCTMTFLCRDILAEMKSKGITASKEEIQYIKSKEYSEELLNTTFTLDYVKEFLESTGIENLKEHEYKKTKVDGQPALVMSATGFFAIEDIKMDVRSINYIVIFENYIINIGAMINGLENNLTDERKKVEPLIQFIINSIVIKNKWKH
jgi:hypothetical protein